tara:strand:+ start:2516 stop:2665 length:150 start_codon:yes stop_codon:yes gene_type:complete
MDKKQKKTILKFVQALTESKFAVADKLLDRTVELKLAKRIAAERNIKPF